MLSRSNTQQIGCHSSVVSYQQIHVYEVQSHAVLINSVVSSLQLTLFWSMARDKVTKSLQKCSSKTFTNETKYTEIHRKSDVV